MPTIAGHYVVAYANSVGFIGNDLRIATAVAKAESGWNTDSRYVTSQEDSRGLWQINTYAHPDLAQWNLYDPTKNAQAARIVWRNAGNKWTPWTTYTRGTYLQFLDDTDAAIAQFRSLGGDPGSTSSTGLGLDAGGEGPVRSQDYAPYDASPYLGQIGDLVNHVAGFLNDMSNALDSIMSANQVNNGDPERGV